MQSFVQLYSANKLKELRKKSNITQDELAEMLSKLKKEREEELFKSGIIKKKSNTNITRQTISKYELGNLEMSLDIIYDLTKIFNIPINIFFPTFHANENYKETHNIITKNEKKKTTGNYFSINLKFIREKKGLSQNKLASMIGVNQTTIARWEDNNRTPSIDNAIDVSNVLNVPLSELLNRDLRLQKKVKSVSSNITEFQTKNGINVTVGHDTALSIDDLLEIQSQLEKYINKD